MFKKSWIKKLENVASMDANTIVLNNGIVVDNDGEMIFFHKINGYRNYGFKNVSRETLTIKTIKNYISDIFYDIENGLFDVSAMI